MVDTAQETAAEGTVSARRVAVPAARAAGWLLVALGAANVALGLLGSATDLIRLSPAVLGGLIVLGAVTVALGVLVRRGSRWALTVALLAFGTLMVLQLGSLQGPAGPTSQSPVPSLVVLVLVVGALGLAQVSSRRR